MSRLFSDLIQTGPSFFVYEMESGLFEVSLLLLEQLDN